MTPNELEEFIAQAQGLGAARIWLRHMVWDPKGQAAFVPLMAWDLNDWDAGLPALADAILAYAKRDANDTGGPQTYSAFGALPNGQDVAQKRWTVAGDKLLSDGAGPTETANTSGERAQSMRHLEAVMRMNVELTTRVCKSQNKENERLEKRVERMEAREMLVLEKLETLMLQEHERKIELTALQGTIDQRGKALGYLEPAIPMLVAKMFGHKLAPQDTPPNALDALLTSVTPEQAAELAKVFNVGQMASLEQLYKERAAAQHAADKAKEAAAAQKPPKSTNGAPAT